MVFWTIWKKFYPTHLTFLGWLNYKLCQKMPKLEKNPCWHALAIIAGSSSIFFPLALKNWKIENLGHFNFRDLFGMFTNGCEPWTTFYHILFDKLEKNSQSKRKLFSLFFQIFSRKMIFFVKFEFSMIWAFIWCTYWMCLKKELDFQKFSYQIWANFHYESMQFWLGRTEKLDKLECWSLIL